MSELERLVKVLRANWREKPEIRVRAILMAMRLPGEAVVAAGFVEIDRDTETSTRCAVCVWQAMIDHILEERAEPPK